MSDIDRLVRQAKVRYDALSPIDKAVHDLKQKRSMTVGLSKMSTPSEVILKTVDAMPEFVVLKAYEEAASELHSLRSQVSRLESALRPFAEYADTRGLVPDDFPISAGSMMARRQLTMGQCRKARSLLAVSGGDSGVASADADAVMVLTRAHAQSESSETEGGAK